MTSWPCCYIHEGEMNVVHVLWAYFNMEAIKGSAFKIEIYCLRKELLTVFLSSGTNSTLSMCSGYLQDI